MSKLICVEGCIGVGKTTLTRILTQRFNAEGVFEDFENNPFLIPYYEQPNVFAFHVQLCFLLLQHAKLLNKVSVTEKRSIYISDFSILKTEIFSKLVLTSEEYKLLAPIYVYLSRTVHKPTLIIYLYGSEPLIVSRIRQRAHPTDAGIQEGYIKQVSAIYSNFFASYNDIPTISMSIDSFDSTLSTHLDNLVTQIHRQVGHL